jgi:hypothetical protein
MKKLLGIMVIATMLLAACGPKNQESDTSLDASAEVPMLSVVDFDSLAFDYVDKQVQLEGVVDHVCKHGGKRLLLVNDGARVHIESNDRFSDDLKGSQVVVTAIVRELKIDEAYCLQQEQDNINKHQEGETSKESFDQKKALIESYRKLMKENGVSYISDFSLDYVSHKVK